MHSVAFLVFTRDHCLMDTMLRTGEVAQILGVSRQHVVDLCDRGELPSVRIGTHRRIARAEVDKRTAHRLTREQEKSLWLHRALMTPLLTDTDTVLDRARENIRRWNQMHRSDGMTVQYFQMWQNVLNQGLDTVLETLTSTSEQACEMRQNSPFAGVLPDQDRVAVLRSFKHHWEREHEHALAG